MLEDDNVASVRRLPYATLRNHELADLNNIIIIKLFT
jgi:hypothetical protein